MDLSHPPSAAAITAQTIYALFAPFPAVCFTLALLTDIVFWQTSYLMWQHFSEWLLLAGLIFGGVAALAGAVRLLLGSEIDEEHGSPWAYAAGNLIVLGLAVFNSFVHAGDGWTGVVPYGLTLSAVTVLLIAATIWLGRSMMFRRSAGARSYEDRYE